MVCVRIFNCNLKEERKLEKWKQPNTLTANIVERQQQAKDSGGRVVIGELLVEFCGIACVVLENSNATSVFDSIQKLKQNKTNLQKKIQPLIRGNKRHRMVAGAWGLECY